VSHFTLQFDAGGPLLRAVVSVSAARAGALTAASQELPPPVPIQALVDTGASCTCIDPDILINRLGLMATGEAECLTPTTGATPQKMKLYDIGLRIMAGSVTEPHLYLDPLPVMESGLFDGQGIHALIGRDVLNRCVLIYNGTTRLFTLSY